MESVPVDIIHNARPQAPTLQASTEKTILEFSKKTASLTGSLSDGVWVPRISEIPTV
jgi:hypothetical protein